MTNTNPQPPQPESGEAKCANCGSPDVIDQPDMIPIGPVVFGYQFQLMKWNAKGVLCSDCLITASQEPLQEAFNAGYDNAARKYSENRHEY